MKLIIPVAAIAAVLVGANAHAFDAMRYDRFRMEACHPVILEDTQKQLDHVTTGAVVNHNKWDGCKDGTMMKPQGKPVAVIPGVNFDFDKATLKPEGEKKLSKFVEGVKDRRSHFDIIGYTDSVGTDEYNGSLSLRRAQTVKSFLVKSGIDASRLTVKGMGEADPVAPNSNATGRAENRRVEIYQEK